LIILHQLFLNHKEATQVFSQTEMEN